MPDASLRERRQALVDRPELRGTAFCRAYAAEADRWLSSLAEAASGGDHRKLALLAVGGYGRGELCPASDLDVVLVHEGRRPVEDLANAIWYPVWDQGVPLDHSVRRPKEVLAMAAEDLRVALGLLDARLVWGDPSVAEPLLADTVAAWRGGGGERWLPVLCDQMDERHRTHGDVAFLLEPDLKEGHGGLRDVNVLRAVAAYAPALTDYVNLQALAPAAEVLTAIRVELHRRAGRALDRLLLQEQDEVAAILDYADADALMAAVASVGRRIAWVSDGAWRRRALWQPAQTRRGLGRRRAGTPGGPPPAAGPGAGGDRPVDDGICVVAGEVAVAPGARVADDPAVPLRLAAVAAELDLPIARASLHRLAEASPSPPDPWPEGLAATLVRALAAGKPAIAALEALDQEELLVRVLPEWQWVRNKPQRNAYHTFTVDRHLLEAATNAAALADRVERPDLLLVGTLLHDIGKGLPGDHTERGIEVVSALAPRMGFVRDDTDALVLMVAQHLLLPEVATRRDLDDPATIETVASAVGTVANLRLLAALTEADSLATGPQAWGGWKAGLVAELTERVAHHLEGAPAPVPAPGAGGGRGVLRLHRPMMDEVRASGRISVVVDPPSVAVSAPDRPGLLAAVAGVLALRGLDVRSANATSEDGVALEQFTVASPTERWPDADQLAGDLEAALDGRLALADGLAARAAAYARGRRPVSAHPVVPGVTVDNGASATSTVIDVRAVDEVGLLHRLAQALLDCHLDVVAARVGTAGGMVVDAFYLRDDHGQKISDPDAVRRLEEAVRSVIGQPADAAVAEAARPV